MKLRILLLFIFCIVTSCKREPKNRAQEWTFISNNLQYKEKDGVLEVKAGKFSYEFGSNQIPFKKIIILNSSMAGYISELDAENRIVGISSPEYIYSDKIQSLVSSKKIQNVGNEQKYDVEKIISLHPDAIFTNYIASFDNTYQLLKNNGIQVIFLDEYKEQKPLEKTAYLKLFGKLLGKDKEAHAKYQEIETNYNALKKLASQSKSKPIVLANEMYGDVWYLPGGNTSVAHYIRDAHADYILKNNHDEKALTMSFEEVFAKSNDVKYWINAGNHMSKKEMLGINPFYGKLGVFHNGNVFTVNGKEKAKANDFFESGVVRSDLILKDYIKIFHPELLPNDQLIYMKELK
ncbi:ABC transporter substrate-binding protein [Chryseobacterium nematophagum]|uniref:ABC transporter substrate-binding protein n=1 Tax=Chryseobacterium nematophagum TaxID=2305228 RepID=A0A3M7TIJ8_9FLAO|nr:ABC transporter substrate-binding protein [Chryseobacterium nematophagum]RNA62040.1 ABC transporter substrate-binding protein [Chryseobacterium nematophagum]